MKLRTQILLFLFLFGLLPLLGAVFLNLPFVLERMESLYHKAHLQNLRADFRNLDQHLARRNEMARVLAKLPEPGIMFRQGREEELDQQRLDQERARYSNWMNRLLANMGDIEQVLFLNQAGLPQFWLSRKDADAPLKPDPEMPVMPSQELIQAALAERHDTVLVSPLVIGDRQAAQESMHLHIVAPIAFNGSKDPVGAAVMSVDIGGMAREYRDIHWVLEDGSYLRFEGVQEDSGNAFADFAGLEQLFASQQLALWQSGRQQAIWLPMFPTDGDGILWVGRAVDPSPLDSVSFSLSLRVAAIITGLVILTLIAAHWVAKRAARVSHRVTEGIRQVVELNKPVLFDWKRPSELRRFGESLTALGQQHHENIARLRAHSQALEASNRYKSEFLANVSHELRTPLNSILLLSKMLAQESARLPAQSAEQARVIHEAAGNLKSLIDNILDMSRIEAGRAALSIQDVPLPDLLADIHSLLAPQFADKGLNLRLVIEPGAPTLLHSDPDKIAQIIRNFLSNSVKFTDRGGATLRLHGNRPDKRYPVCISVEDSGIGIPSASLGRIFAAFHQADGSTSRRYGGSGLGLTISRQLAQLLGGDILVESTPGQGSCFTLGLPQAFDEQLAEGRRIGHEPAELSLPELELAGSPEADFSGQGILIVDNDIDSLLRLTPLLEGWRMRVCAAADSEEAADTLRDQGGDCGLVLLNGAMGGSGLRATIGLLASLEPDQRPRVLLLAKTQGQQLEGVDRVLDPPFNPMHLQQAISRLISEAASGQRSAAS
ncbi:MAG: ATP-binding protein [Gammaproteobacteria bacterium SHHR-1]|uniref:ATP-binding protein n=1 Tax=Magnetovirga frankeli TaxID=947516 RepID=UPI0012938ACB|nr:histidine kinase [gamma proteobacterium SS-5]